jgi:hypothetical protein
MSKDKNRRPSNKKEERDTLLAKFVRLVPLVTVTLQLLDLLIRPQTTGKKKIKPSLACCKNRC